MRRTIGLAICFSVFVLFTASPAATFADEARSYEQLSPNGKYVFVMLTKGPDKAHTVDTLKTKYSHSGLYNVSGPRKSIWRVNWYSSHVHVSSDGIHLVRIGRVHVAPINGKPNMAQLAIAFYGKGNVIRKYLIEDLLKDPARLVKSGADFQWQKRIAFDDASGRLDVTLVTGQQRIFDIKSGNIVPVKRGKSRKLGP